MEAPKPIIPSKMKDFPVFVGKDNFNLSISYSNDSIKFFLNHKDKNDEPLKFAKSFSFEELNKISKWFKIFDSLEEVYEDIIKLMENKQVNINLEENIAKLVFNINMEKIKEFDIVLAKKELTKDELINNLISENKELKIKVNNLEKRINSLEERFKSFRKKIQR
jgi:chaperonin cofactor prefoldin